MEKTKSNFKFNTQLKIGKSGEDLFKKHYGPIYGIRPDSESMEYDFILENGAKVELKTDTYAMSDTPNFFFERFSDINTKKLGGPWRAKKDEVDYFVYLYVKDKMFYWFNPILLCAELDKITKKMQTKHIRNIAWTTSGFAVPRELCLHVCLRQEKI
jgi:hypothetical protein